MSEAYGPTSEALFREIVALRRRLDRVERAGTGLVTMLGGVAANVNITLTATPGTLVASVTVTRAGAYAMLGSWDFTASATGFGDVVGVFTLNGVEIPTAPFPRYAVLRDNGLASQRATVANSLGGVATVAGDVIGMYAWKTAGGGTIVASVRSGLTVVRTGAA